jgi:hypothetical protein
MNRLCRHSWSLGLFCISACAGKPASTTVNHGQPRSTVVNVRQPAAGHAAALVRHVCSTCSARSPSANPCRAPPKNGPASILPSGPTRVGLKVEMNAVAESHAAGATSRPSSMDGRRYVPAEGQWQVHPWGGRAVVSRRVDFRRRPGEGHAARLERDASETVTAKWNVIHRRATTKEIREGRFSLAIDPPTRNCSPLGRHWLWELRKSKRRTDKLCSGPFCRTARSCCSSPWMRAAALSCATGKSSSPAEATRRGSTKPSGSSCR